MHDVARAAGVSKGLIHYHFQDKEALLARLAVWLADALDARERGLLAGITPQLALDALWAWLDSELARGDVRALLDLAQLSAPSVREATRQAARRRRETAASTVETLFGALGLRPRIPAALLADVAVAFIDGLAMDAAIAPAANRRVVFDAFWLSVLSLTE